MKAKNDDIYDEEVYDEDIYEAGYEAGYYAAVTNSKRKQQVQPRNQTAFVIGIIAGFFGIWGLSHVLNDKVGSGCLWMFIVGPGIMMLLAGITLASAGAGAILVFPLWLYIVYMQAKNGASII